MIAPTYRLLQLNIAAVHLQVKEYEKARDACDKVIVVKDIAGAWQEFMVVYYQEYTYSKALLNVCFMRKLFVSGIK